MFSLRANTCKICGKFCICAPRQDEPQPLRIRQYVIICICICICHYVYIQKQQYTVDMDSLITLTDRLVRFHLQYLNKLFLCESTSAILHFINLY